MLFMPNEQGFVTNWLICGPVCNSYSPPDNLAKAWTDQLGYEKTLRSIFYPHLSEQPFFPHAIGQTGSNGAVWQYYYHHNSSFVDLSSVHRNPTSIRLDAVTVLNSKSEQMVDAVFWTYGALDVWLNGQHVLYPSDPVYKPIAHYNVKLALKKGENKIYIVMHNLGVRDTRNIFALQLKETYDVSISLPDDNELPRFIAAQEWLNGLFCTNGYLYSEKNVPENAFIKTQNTIYPLTGNSPWKIDQAHAVITVCVKIADSYLERKMELLEHITRKYIQEQSNHYLQFLKRFASEKNQPRENGACFSVFHVLARLALGLSTQEDELLLMDDLDYIENRGDCADFLVIGFIRLLHNYSVNPVLYNRIKTVLLGFRYWMDEPGTDGMCFWSENHALMFYGAQLVVGKMFENELFTCSNRTGAQQEEIARQRCLNWLQDVENCGVEEFNSASYMPVTLAALLNLVDYAPQEFSLRAKNILDSLLCQLCCHVFDQSVISPQGRVYRDVIHPCQQTVQTLLHLIDPTLPYSSKESIWCVCFETSKYQFPVQLKELMKKEKDISYISGNARIELKKEKDYILTSVRCPRESNDSPDWINLCFVPNADRNTNTYVKSLNERFHGTTVFEPGVYGYQQHLWYAALSSQAVVFVNHPGTDTDFDHMRPGYWFGNGVMPAVLQKGNVLGAIYKIPKNNPITFTHTFWPMCQFDHTEQNNHWMFARLNDGFIGLWCSGKQIIHQDALTNAEYRCYGSEMAYFCVCGSRTDFLWDGFKEYCSSLEPLYDANTGKLTANNYELTYVACENKTQFI